METTVLFGANIKTALLAALAQAEKELFIAVYTFNNSELLQALSDCCARGVKVNLLVNQHENAQNNLNYNKLLDQYNTNIFDLYQLPTATRTMHHKFCVIDGQQVFTGSANWTNAAFNSNDENTLHLTNAAELSAQYQAEFERICAPMRQNVTDTAQQIEQKGREITNELLEYTSFVANYLRKHKTMPPKHLLPAVQPELNALLSAVAPITILPTASIVDEKLWRSAVLKYGNSKEPKNGFIIVIKDNKQGAINMQGEEIIPCVYDELFYFDENGYAICKLNYKYGFVIGNKQSYEFIPPIYQGLTYFSEGLAAAKLGGKYGYINTAGQTVILHQFKDCKDFQKSKKDPTQIFAIAISFDNNYFIMDKTGKQMGGFYKQAECQRRIDELDFEEAQ